MTAPLKSGHRSAIRIFTWPLVIALASLIGLVSALVGDGLFDIVSWILLGGVIMLLAERLR